MGDEQMQNKWWANAKWVMSMRRKESSLTTRQAEFKGWQEKQTNNFSTS